MKKNSTFATLFHGFLYGEGPTDQAKTANMKKHLNKEERPILFSGEMVRAILDGRKTQTRRVVNCQCLNELPDNFKVVVEKRTGLVWTAQPIMEIYGDTGKRQLRCPYGKVGDVLWVRETFRVITNQNRVIYRADKERSLGMDEYSDRHKWKPSIHMPRRAARIFLKITNIRIERIQDISPGDIRKEGVVVELENCLFAVNRRAVRESLKFMELWDSINKKRGYGWDKNPWVWVVEFQKEERRQ